MVEEILLFSAGSLGRLVKRIADQNHRTIGLTSSQLSTLILLVRDGSANQKKIEEELNLTRASVSEMMDNLEKLGLVMREKDSSDARVRNIVITDEGKKKLEEARAFSASIETSLQSVISEEERTSFITICNKLKNVLEESLC